MHKETPSHAGPRGSCNIFEKPGKAGTWRAVNRESCTSQPLKSSWTVASNRRQAQGTKSGVAYKPSQHAQPLQHRGQAQVAACDKLLKKGRDWGSDRGEVDKLGQRTLPSRRHSLKKNKQPPRQRVQAVRRNKCT